MRKSNVKGMTLLLGMLLLSLCCYAGRGFEQLNQYQQLEEMGSLQHEYYSQLAEIGTNFLERCKSDPIFLDAACGAFKRKVLAGDNVPALILAAYMHDFSPQKGEEFLLELAEKGDTDAMTLLAALYYASNEKSALKWLRKAAEAEDQDALELLIAEYKTSIPASEYVKHVKRLADKENERALITLAIMYMTGDGVEVNQKKAVELTKKAWSQGVVGAGLMLALLYKDEASKTSLSWMKKGAEAGDRIAQYEWAEILFAGEYTKKNEKEGLRWLRLSAEAGYPLAQYELGRQYYDGFLVEKNHEIAFEWFRKSAKQDYMYAQYKVGVIMYRRDKPQDALVCFREASLQGHTNALAAVKYLEGKGGIAPKKGAKGRAKASNEKEES